MAQSFASVFAATLQQHQHYQSQPMCQLSRTSHSTYFVRKATALPTYTLSHALFIYKKDYHHTALISKLHTLEHC